ncbi:MAG: hypothetical protein ACTSYA_05660 [Candidatus Kariarchaeaceae archaeon]
MSNSKLHLKKQGNGSFVPFKTEKEAFKFVDDEFDGDGEIIEVDGGYAVKKNKKSTEPPMEYFECTIAPRMSQSDPLIIPLGVNGVKYNVRRGEKVILPQSHIEVAQHASRIQYEMKGSILHRVGEISSCPIVVGAKSNKEEFQEMLKSGNMQRDKDIAIRDANARS